MYIVAIAWMYVVSMMAITEDSVVAGVMTLTLYGIVPLSIVLYIMGTGARRRRRAAIADAERSATPPITESISLESTQSIDAPPQSEQKSQSTPL